MKQWYLAMKPADRLLITWLLNFLLWFSMNVFTEWFMPGDSGRHVWLKTISKSLFMSLVWTLLMSDRNLIRAVFYKKKEVDAR